MRSLLKCVPFLALAVLSSNALAQQVDNPAYVSWAKYKAGSSLTLKQTSTMAMMGGMTTETTITQKLIEVKPESVTVEVTTKTSVMGQANETKMTSVIPAK